MPTTVGDLDQLVRRHHDPRALERDLRRESALFARDPQRYYTQDSPNDGEPPETFAVISELKRPWLDEIDPLDLLQWLGDTDHVAYQLDEAGMVDLDWLLPILDEVGARYGAALLVTMPDLITERIVSRITVEELAADGSLNVLAWLPYRGAEEIA